MLECFATWCGPCRNMIPHLAELTKDYPSVYIISVSRETEEEVKALMVNTPKMSEYNLAYDPTENLNQYMDQQNVNGIPHSFIYNGQGELLW